MQDQYDEIVEGIADAADDVNAATVIAALNTAKLSEDSSFCKLPTTTHPRRRRRRRLRRRRTKKIEKNQL